MNNGFNPQAAGRSRRPTRQDPGPDNVAMAGGSNHVIEATLLRYLREECLPGNGSVTVGLDDNLFDRGIVDSAGLISFIGFMEKEFGLTIPDEDLLPDNFMSVAAIARYVRSHQQEPHGSQQKMSRLGS